MLIKLFLILSIYDVFQVVYVLRNPKDAVVSYLHHCRIMKMQDFTGTQDEFVELFMNGDCEFYSVIRWYPDIYGMKYDLNYTYNIMYELGAWIFHFFMETAVVL